MRLVNCLALVSSLIVNTQGLRAFASDTKTAEQIFSEAKPSMVTLFTAVNQGCGFFVDDSGLILTSSRAVKGGEGYLHVRLSNGDVLPAEIMVNDGIHDIAVVKVNLSKAGTQKVLALSAADKTDLVKHDEDVVAIGGPLDRLNHEPVMVLGKVDKLDDDVISHNATINAAATGGPLLNYDGQVVGVNSIKEDEKKGISIAQAAPISFAAHDIQEAKGNPSKKKDPSPDLLPDYPSVPFPMAQLLKSNPDLLKGHQQKQYNFSSEYFSVCVLTPVEGHNQLAKTGKETDQELLEVVNSSDKKKRASSPSAKVDPIAKVDAPSKVAVVDKKGIAKANKANDSYAADDYYRSPVVTVLVIPKPKYTKGAYARAVVYGAGIGVAAAALGPAGIPLLFLPLAMHEKLSVKREFEQLSLETADDKVLAMPIASGRVPFSKQAMNFTGFRYRMLVDNADMGIYTFDAHNFETDQKLKLVVRAEGKDKTMNIDFPESVKKLIVADFKPYWSYVAEQSPDNKAGM